MPFAANPRITFPLHQRLEEIHTEIGYLLKLYRDWESLINMGMDIEAANDLIRDVHSKNLLLENYND